MKKLILDGTGSTVNNVIKALLIGFIVGLIVGTTQYNLVQFIIGTENLRGDFRTSLALISGVIVSAMLFLKYNTKEK